MQEQGGKEARVKGEKPSAMEMSGNGIAGQSTAFIPTCHEVLPAGYMGTDIRLGRGCSHPLPTVFNTILLLLS